MIERQVIQYSLTIQPLMVNKNPKSISVALLTTDFFMAIARKISILDEIFDMFMQSHIVYNWVKMGRK